MILVTGATGRVGRLVIDELLRGAAQVHAIGDAINRTLRFEELSPDEFRSEVEGTWPRGVADMLLAAWQAALGRPAFVTSAVHEIRGVPPRTFRDWAVDNAAAFTRNAISAARIGLALGVLAIGLSACSSVPPPTPARPVTSCVVGATQAGS